MSKISKSGFLKKTKILNKAIAKAENSFNKNSKATSSEETKFNLPPIEKQLYRKAILQPTSVLTRYLERQTHTFLKNTEEELNRPIKINSKLKRRKRKK